MIVSSHLTEVICYVISDRIVTCILIILVKRAELDEYHPVKLQRN